MAAIFFKSGGQIWRGAGGGRNAGLRGGEVAVNGADAGVSRIDGQMSNRPIENAAWPARRMFSTHAGIRFWPRRGRKHHNAREPRCAHTCFVYPVFAHANRLNCLRYFERQLIAPVRQLPLAHYAMRRSAFSNRSYNRKKGSPLRPPTSKSTHRRPSGNSITAVQIHTSCRFFPRRARW